MTGDNDSLRLPSRESGSPLSDDAEAAIDAAASAPIDSVLPDLGNRTYSAPPREADSGNSGWSNLLDGLDQMDGAELEHTLEALQDEYARQGVAGNILNRRELEAAITRVEARLDDVLSRPLRLGSGTTALTGSGPMGVLDMAPWWSFALAAAVGLILLVLDIRGGSSGSSALPVASPTVYVVPGVAATAPARSVYQYTISALNTSFDGKAIANYNFVYNVSQQLRPGDPTYSREEMVSFTWRADNLPCGNFSARADRATVEFFTTNARGQLVKCPGDPPWPAVVTVVIRDRWGNEHTRTSSSVTATPTGAPIAFRHEGEVPVLVAPSSTASPAQTSAETPATGDSGGVGAVGIAGGALLVVGAVGAGVRTLHKREAEEDQTHDPTRMEDRDDLAYEQYADEIDRDQDAYLEQRRLERERAERNGSSLPTDDALPTTPPQTSGETPPDDLPRGGTGREDARFMLPYDLRGADDLILGDTGTVPPPNHLDRLLEDIPGVESMRRELPDEEPKPPEDEPGEVM